MFYGLQTVCSLGTVMFSGTMWAVPILPFPTFRLWPRGKVPSPLIFIYRQQSVDNRRIAVLLKMYLDQQNFLSKLCIL